MKSRIGKPDYRTTLFWTSTLQTNAEGKAISLTRQRRKIARLCRVSNNSSSIRTEEIKLPFTGKTRLHNE